MLRRCIAVAPAAPRPHLDSSRNNAQEADIITQINVFTVAPEKQQTLVDLLDMAARTSMKQQPGFISASVRKSDDGKRVIKYAQWRSKADLQAMHDNPHVAEHMKAAADLAEFDPIVCEVRSSNGS